MPDSKVKVTIEFTAYADLEVPLDELNSEDFDLSDPDELREAVDLWVGENAKPNVYYQSYSSDSGMIKIREQEASYSVSEEYKLEINNEENF